MCLVRSRTGTVNTHAVEHVRYAPFPFECLPQTSVRILADVRDCSRDVGLLKPELLRYLKRPFRYYLCSTLPIHRRAWSNGPDRQEVRLQVEVSVQQEHPQPCCGDTRVTSVYIGGVCNYSPM